MEYVLSNGGQAVVNLGNKYISQKYQSITGYGQKEYAHPRDQNADGAWTMAQILGIKNKYFFG